MAVIIGLLLLLQLLILLPPIQRKLKTETEKALETPLNAKVTIGDFRLGFPKKLKVQNILIASQNNDTLAYLGEFSVNIRVLPLLRKNIIVQNIGLRYGKGDIGKLLAGLPTDTTQTEPATSQTNESNPWSFSIESARVENCYFSYRDETITGFNLLLDIGQTAFHFGTLDFEKLIQFESAEISNTFVSYQPLEIEIEEDPNDTTITEMFDLQIHDINLQKSEFNFIDSVGFMIFKAGGKKIEISDFLLDINEAAISFNDGKINESTCSVKFLPNPNPIEDDGSDDYLNWGQFLWRVSGNQISLDNFNMRVNDQTVKNTPGHFNNGHLNFTSLRGTFTEIILDTDTLSLQIQNLSGREENGLEIAQMNGSFFHKDDLFFINNLNIQTAVSSWDIDIKTTVSPTDYTVLKGQIFDISISNESDGLNDINYFYPLKLDAFLPIDKIIDNNFGLKAQLVGTTDSMQVTNLQFQYLDSTFIKLNGHAKSLLNPETIQANISTDEVYIYKNDLRQTIVSEYIDSVKYLPDWIDINGNYKLNAQNHHFIGLAKSNFGNISNIDLFANLANKNAYSASFDTKLFNLEKFTNSDLKQLNLQFAGIWNGETLYNSSAKFNLFVDTLVYQKSEYEGIRLNGTLENGIFGTRLQSPDTSLMFDIKVEGELSPDHIIASGNFDIKNINLHQFGFSDSTLKVSNKTGLDVTYQDRENFAVSTVINRLQFQLPDTAYGLHAVNLDLKTSNQLTDLKLSSYFYNLTFNCADNFTNFIHDISQLPGYYLRDLQQDTIPYQLAAFNLKGNLNYPEAFMHLFFPNLPVFTHLSIDGGYDPAGKNLHLNMAVPGFSYSGINTDSLHFNLQGDGKTLAYDLFSYIQYDDLFKGKIDLAGKFANSELTNQLQYFDAYNDPYLNLTFKTDTSDGSLDIQFIPDHLIFSYDQWEINENNRFLLNPEFLSFKDFKLKSGEQIIQITCPADDIDDIRLELKNFGMGSIERVLDLDTLVYGIAQADFLFSNLLDEPSIAGDLQIDEMELFDFNFGKFTLSPFSYDKNHLYFDLALLGKHEDIQISGGQSFSDSLDNINLAIDINFVDIGQLNYLLREHIRDAAGSLEGKFTISGNMQSPVLNGDLQFHEAKLGLIAFNNTFTLGNDHLHIQNNNLVFDRFEIRNSENQRAALTGNIYLANDGRVYNDFHILTEKMEIMNSSRKENDILYGLLKAKTEISVKGPSDKIAITADVIIDRSSDITYTLPDELTLQNHDGVVAYGKFNPETIDDEDQKKASGFFSMEGLSNFKSRIEIEDGAKVNIFFDHGGDDFLKAELNGFVNYNLIENNPEVSGTFQITEGILNYVLPMIAVEEYQIEPGSFITLSNDVYNPYLKIVAASTIRASTEGLMSADPKVMDFKVLMYLEGELNDLQLQFDISTETSDALVSARLAQLTEEERNINALNLLVRGSFVLSIEGDELGGTSAANAQIDKFYATHLNHLIGENISFVDLKFDVQSFKDYDEQGDAVLRRNYYYNIGKSFFDDRARINYKGNIGTSVNEDSDQVNSHFVQNQLEIELKITEDGTVKGVFFRKNKYEGLLEGEVIETGAGIKIGKDYESVGDIFKNKNKSVDN